MTSLSTWFFGQPRVTKWTLRDGIALLPGVRQLHRDAEVLLAQQVHDGLQIVALLAADAHLVALDGGLHLELGLLHELRDLASLLDGDALLAVELLLGRSPRP